MHPRPLHAVYLACWLALLPQEQCAREISLDELLIPKGATVVLLPSLAGDAESERTYRDHLASLIAAVQKSGAQRVVIFWEGTDVELPSGVSGTRASASREQFLLTARQLAGPTNPLVVFAWGHGGMQGKNPVFHVRGPRITPADFSSFAREATSGRSVWVLMFRGSGRFAAELAGPGRCIVSSENESMFRSDPIGMNVLVKRLRSEPAITLRGLLDSIGPAIASWYDDQSLARTEEPTLWLDTRKPVALASAERLLEKPAVPAASDPGPEPSKKDSVKRAAQWVGMARVRAEDYPDADAVVLKRAMTYTLAGSPAIAAEHDEYIQILTPEGKDAGDFDVSYSPPEEKLEFLDCEIEKPDGSLLRMDPDEIREADEPSAAPGAGRERRKFFSMPDVGPGAIVRVRYAREWQKFPLPQVTLELPLVDEMPVREATIRISVPRESAFHFRLENMPAVNATITQTEYTSSYTWALSNLAGWNPPPLTQPNSEPALLVSTFPDWKAFAGWYDRIIRLADQPTAEITNKAAEITRELKTDGDKIKALYDYVTGLRYVAVPLGVNSFRPHAAAGVLRNQYGDCKDKANLFNALLRSQGIAAHLVLVPRFAQAYDDLPGFAFNHAISRVLLNGQPLWLDTTDDVCRFGMLPPGDHGRRVLVIDGATERLTLLPEADASEHVVRLVTRATLEADDVLRARVRLEAKGYPDYELRANARTMGKRSSVPLLNSLFRLANGSFALEAQTFTSPSDLKRDFVLETTGSAIGMAHGTPQRMIRAPLWVPVEWSPALHARSRPLFLNDGYPLLVRQEVTITLPGDALMQLPARREHKDGPLRWSLGWSQQGRQLGVSFDCELQKAELTGDESLAFQNAARKLLAALAAPAILSQTKP